jgi:ArsR family transcriptional regulator
VDKQPAADSICAPSPETEVRKSLQYPEKRISLTNMKKTTALFKALAHDTRLRILNLLLDGEVCVCRIMEILELPQSTASRHLGILKNAGLLDDRREGIWVHYSLAREQRPLALQILAALQDHLPLLDICRSDRQRLQQPRSPNKLCG